MNLSKSIYTKAFWLKKYKLEVLTPSDKSVFETENIVGDLAYHFFKIDKIY